MKRYNTTLIVFIAFLLVAGTAYAGIGDVWSAFTGKFVNVGVGSVVSWIFSATFFLFGVFKWKAALRYRNTASELGDVIAAVYGSTRKDSPGGAKITGKEFDKIFAECGELAHAAIEDTTRGK